MSKPKCVVVIKVDEKTYENPLHAAQLWMTRTMANVQYAARRRTPGNERALRAINWAHNKRNKQRYLRMVRPYFERLLFEGNKG